MSDIRLTSGSKSITLKEYDSDFNLYSKEGNLSVNTNESSPIIKQSNIELNLKTSNSPISIKATARGEKGEQGIPGIDGIQGIDGEDGKSAYQVWLDEGNIGTEQDFLDSLKGIDGLTTSVNDIEQVDGNVELDTDDIPETTTNMYVPTLPTDNPTSLYLNGSREWKPTSIGGGGYNANLYFTTLDSDVLGYKIIDYSFEPTETILQIPATTTETLIRAYLFPHEIATNIIDAGLWGINYRCMVDKTAGVTRLAFEPFVRHADETETNLFAEKAYSDEINNTAMTTIRQEINQPSFTVDETDRFGCRIYAVTTHPAGVTISTVVGDGHASYFNIPIKLRHSQLRDFNEDENYQHIPLTEVEKIGGVDIVVETTDDLPDEAHEGDLAIVKARASQDKSDTIFSLETIYSNIYLNPTPQKFSELAPDWEYIFEGVGYIVASDKVLLLNQYEQGIGQDYSPEVLFVSYQESGRTFVYLYEYWQDTELDAGWYELIDDMPIPVNYADLPSLEDVEFQSFDTPEAFEELKWVIPYYLSDTIWTVSNQLYGFINNEWIPLSGGVNNDSITVVDCYDDLPVGIDGQLAIVKQDTLAPRTWTTMAKNTLYSRLYVNPLPYLWGEDYEDYIGLSLDSGGTQIYAAVEPSEAEGFILCTLQLKGILLSAATAMAVQQNYINTPFEISFDGRTYIEVEGGWINTLAYADIATNEVTDVTMTPTNAGNIKSFADTYLLTANDTADEWLRVKYLIQPTPFTINYSGVYEKINSVWTLVMRNDKLVNGNTTAPE